AAGDWFAGHLVAALTGRRDVIDDLIRLAPRRRVHRSTGARNLALGAARDIDRPDRTVVPRRGKGDLGVIRRPARHVVVGRILGELAEAAVAGVEDPDVVVAGERIAAVRRERHMRAVVRPRGL